MNRCLVTGSVLGFLMLAGCGAAPEEDAQGVSEAMCINCPPPPPASTVKVINTSTNRVVFSKSVSPTGTHMFGNSELGATLAAESLGLAQTRIDFQSDNTSTELLAFARDPSEHASTIWNMLGNLYNAGYLSQHTYLFPWDADVTVTPASAVALPNVLSLTYPSHNCLFAPCGPATFSSGGQSFWQVPTQTWTSGPSTAVPGLSSPNGEGSLRALAIVDHGACSQAVTWSSVGSQILDGTWAQIKAKAVGAGWPVNGAEQFFAGATSYLEHHVGTEGDMTGGIIAAMRYQILVDNPFSNKTMDFTAKWAFTLTGGILDAQEVNYWNTPDTYAPSDLASAMKNDVPTQIHTQALAKQLAPVPTQPGYAKTLAGTKQMLSDILDAGGSTVVGLTASELTSVKAAINSSANWTNFNKSGACGLVDGANVCQFIVRAKRLNVLPDAAELVFFDGKEPTNPTYALYAALRVADQFLGSSNVSQLCGTRSFGPFDWHTDSADWTSRRYYSETRTTSVFTYR